MICSTRRYANHDQDWTEPLPRPSDRPRGAGTKPCWRHSSRDAPVTGLQPRRLAQAFARANSAPRLIPSRRTLTTGGTWVGLEVRRYWPTRCEGFSLPQCTVLMARHDYLIRRAKEALTHHEDDQHLSHD